MEKNKYSDSYKLKNKIEEWLAERYGEYKDINNDFVDVQFNSIKFNVKNWTLKNNKKK